MKEYSFSGFFGIVIKAETGNIAYRKLHKIIKKSGLDENIELSAMEVL